MSDKIIECLHVKIYTLSKAVLIRAKYVANGFR